MSGFNWTALGNGFYEDYHNWNNWAVGAPPVYPGVGAEVALPSEVSAYSVLTGANDAAGSVATGADATLVLGGAFRISGQQAGDINAGAIVAGAILHFAGSLVNSGSLTLLGSSATLLFDGPTALAPTFTGGGQIVLSGLDATSAIYATNGATVDNVDNTITGKGSIGLGYAFKLVNGSAARIQQTGASGLTLDIGGAGIVNAGLISSTGSGGLTILSTVVDDSGSSNAGAIQANGAGAVVYLQSAHIVGGSLSTSGGGIIQTTDSGSTIDSSGGSIKASATIEIANNNYLTIGGSLSNAGVINIQSSGNATGLRIDNNNLVLSGGGRFTLSDNANNYVYGVSSGDVLVNTNNTLSGAGQLGYGQLTVVN
jgi:hypothetical protein